jgi:hypothetical protein
MSIAEGWEIGPQNVPTDDLGDDPLFPVKLWHSILLLAAIHLYSKCYCLSTLRATYAAVWND